MNVWNYFVIWHLLLVSSNCSLISLLISHLGTRTKLTTETLCKVSMFVVSRNSNAYNRYWFLLDQIMFTCWPTRRSISWCRRNHSHVIRRWLSSFSSTESVRSSIEIDSSCKKSFSDREKNPRIRRKERRTNLLLVNQSFIQVLSKNFSNGFLHMEHVWRY